MTSGITRGHRGVKAELPPNPALPETMKMGIPQPHSNTKHPFERNAVKFTVFQKQLQRSSINQLWHAQLRHWKHPLLSEVPASLRWFPDPQRGNLEVQGKDGNFSSESFVFSALPPLCFAQPTTQISINSF